MIQKGRLLFSPCDYCSKECAAEGLKKRVERICQACGEKFDVIPARIEIGSGKYCSDFCRLTMLTVHGFSSHGKIFYTPELIRSLMGPITDKCNFPECEELKTIDENSRWHLCVKHKKLVKHALEARRQRRNKIIRAHGLIVIKQKGHKEVQCD